PTSGGRGGRKACPPSDRPEATGRPQLKALATTIVPAAITAVATRTTPELTPNAHRPPARAGPNPPPARSRSVGGRGCGPGVSGRAGAVRTLRVFMVVILLSVSGPVTRSWTDGGPRRPASEKGVLRKVPRRRDGVADDDAAQDGLDRLDDDDGQ